MNKVLCFVLSFVLSFVMFFACQNPNTKNVDEVEQKEVVSQESPYSNLGPLPFDQIKFMHTNCDQIDYIFNELPISMALSEKSAVQNNVTFISPDKMTGAALNCKPLGRQLFYSKGELYIEADLFFDDQCKFLVFLEDRKPKYANKLTQQGINFYNNIMQQVNNAQPGQ
jgi:hypothetical protein